MNLIEALKELYNGKPVRCKIWDPQEFFEFNQEGYLINEEGKRVNLKDLIYIGSNKTDISRDKYEIYIKPQSLLDDIEKEFLNKYLSPFKDQIISIQKERCGKKRECQYRFERLRINLRVKEGKTPYFCLPDFDIGAMYRGMKSGKEYTLKELELTGNENNNGK